MFMRLLLGFALASCAAVSWASPVPQWPVIQEFEKSFDVVADAEKIVIDVPLYDVKGVQRYVFLCRGGSTAYLDQLSDSTGDNYVGDLMCGLTLPGDDIEQSLLGEDDSAVWFSRGQYHWDELLGDCGAYPEYGRLRHFSLRGFVLTLAATQVKQDMQGKLISFTLQVSLKDDPGAKAAQAAQTGYIRPKAQPGACKKVIKGDEPRMCRDWNKGGSWEECKNI